MMKVSASNSRLYSNYFDNIKKSPAIMGIFSFIIRQLESNDGLLLSFKKMRTLSLLTLLGSYDNVVWVFPRNP
ncbi:hypothetical protein SAMN05444392_107151 [Seinonella peptonophila]|uniref:Uncharacterized protein n=2 Tax=Seinonella peptonophila TaxID=112248 RepID=A0A1M4YUY8_9BACL|nr:hypothetical protein SAMN05444392_107151 [Seinonella peptonophila]